MAAVEVSTQGAPGIPMKPSVAVKSGSDALAGDHAPTAGGGGVGSQMRSDNTMDKDIENMEGAIRKLEVLKKHLEGERFAKATVAALGDMVDEMCIDVCIEVHRWHRLGVLVIDGDHSKTAANRIVDLPGYDVHGQVPEKVPKNEHFNCDHCGTKVGASKYAAHLAKCMGHGGRRMRSREGAGDAAGAAVSASPTLNRAFPSPTNHVSASGVSPVGLVSDTRCPPAASPARLTPSLALSVGAALGRASPVKTTDLARQSPGRPTPSGAQGDLGKRGRDDE